jgi:DNA-binding NtrC family response regulator
MKRVLVVDDEEFMVDSIKKLLRKRGFEVEGFNNPVAALNFARRSHFDVALVDFRMPNIDGIEMIENLKNLHPQIKIVLMTAYASVANAVEAMKKGADEYIAKPFSFDDLEDKLRELGLRRQIPRRNSFPGEYDILGGSLKMLELKEKIPKVAKSNATVLICGESGTGKELVARQIHIHSPRSHEPFVAVNMAAIPDTLIESEFFGYRKGSFTGAEGNYDGKFMASGAGTIFLDEISEIPLAFQAKLLRVLQEYVIQPLGSSETIPIKARFVAATNQNMQNLMQTGRFREDLFYRLNIVEIFVPTLRERISDIPVLTTHFLSKHATESMEVTEHFIELLKAYSWPGNVRELENVLHRCIILSDSNVLDAADLPAHISGLQPRRETPLTDVIYQQLSEGKSLYDLEKEIILKAIEEAGGNKTNAAKLLKITRRKLYSRLDKHGIKI